MKLRLAALAAALVASACAPSIRPEMQAATDAKIRSYSAKVSLPAPGSYAPREWKPGQWIAFRSEQKDKPPSVTVLKVLSKDALGYWLETETNDYYGHTVSKVLYSRMPKSAEDAMDALQRVITKQNDEPVQDFDFASNPMAGFMKATMKHLATGVSAPTDVSGAPKESVTVAAGTFEASAKYTGQFAFGPYQKTVTGWYHPGVPLNGGVRSETTDGEIRTELLAFGEEGATSALK